MAGPFTKVTGNTSSASFRSQTWSTQSKPYVAPLPYRLVVANTTRGKWGCGAHYRTDTLIGWANLSNRLAQKIHAAVGERAQLSVTLAERKQAVSMITRRATQLVKAVRAVRKGKFGSAARVLGLSKPPTGTTRHKQFANNWLEFSFGWKPFIQDIGAAVDVLQGPIPNLHVRARAAGTWSASNTGGAPPGVPGPGKEANWRDTITARFQAGCDIVCVNSDLFLANQLGFVNPATVIWELVPFSFIVDWFVSVGAFLEGMTALIGVTLKNKYTTKAARGMSDHVGRSPSGGPIYDTGTWFEMQRTLGLPSISITVKPFKGFSVARGLNAISVLIQQLRK